MELTVSEVILRLAFLGVNLFLSVLFFAYFMGMHGNTIDGNSFRLLNPLALFDPSQFTEEGNRYRLKFLKLWLALIPMGIVNYLVVFYSN